MAQRSTCDVEQRSFTAGARRQSVGVGYSGPSLRTTAIAPSARDLQIVDSTLSVFGGDQVHNHSHHYHYERSRDVWAILQSIPNFRNIYHDMLSKATSGTGMWIVKGDKFRIWLEANGDIKIFWGSGIPGAGKTLLASIVIEHLESLREENPAICVCYVYFRYSDRSEMTVRDVLEILVKQTLERHPEYLEFIQQTYAQHIREDSEPAEAQLLGLLRELADRMACTFYVLDALDEAPTKIQLAVVKTLASLNVKLFITSRPLKAVEANFPEAHTFPIFAHEKDIDLHIAKQLDESADLQNLIREVGPSLKEEIISRIKQNCGGMFLHAALQLDALCDCLSAQEVEDTLEAFPSSIEDVYHHTWARICNQSRNHASLAKTALVWVLYASRSMTVEELKRAVATSPTTHKFEPSRLVPWATLLSLCRGLVTVEEESGIVRLVHYTAKETLEGLLRESFPHPHSLLAAVCMKHLSECGFQNTTIGSQVELRETLERDPLLAYASEAWAFHAHAALDEEDTKCRTAQFIGQSRAFPAFTDLDRLWDFDILTPLHILAFYDLPLALIQDALVTNLNVATKVLRRSPLMTACRSSHQTFVTQLLALSETQVNLADNNGSSALVLAAEQGHESVVKLLSVHPEIQINQVNNHGHSAMTWAAWHGFEGVVKHLVTCARIQINLTTPRRWSALILAAKEGHEGTVKLILAHPGTQVNLANDGGSTALMRAAEHGQEGALKLLLARPEIEVNLVQDDGWFSLTLAVVNGHGGVVKHLLAHPEIQVNLVDKHGSSALILAAGHGHEGVVKLLLAHPGILVNLVNNEGCSALMMATRYGFAGVVKHLLPHPEIQVNLVDNDGWSALMSAARHGYEGVIKLLLAHPGIQANLVQNDGWSALMFAARYGYEGVVKLLLAHPEIQVNLANNKGWSALILAAKKGHEGVFKLLLAYPEIQVDLVSGDKSTALLVAAECGHNALVKLLLATGSFNVNAFDKDSDTAIKMAAKEGHEDIVRILLDIPNIDITIRSTTDEHTAMSAALANGHSGIVALLQDFESRRAGIASPSELSRVSMNDGADEDDSASDCSESYQDAEEGL